MFSTLIVRELTILKTNKSKSKASKGRTGLLQDDPEEKANVKGYEGNPSPSGELRRLVERLLVHLKENIRDTLPAHLHHDYSDEKSDYEDDCEHPAGRRVRGPAVKPDLVGLKQTSLVAARQDGDLNSE